MTGLREQLVAARLTSRLHTDDTGVESPWLAVRTEEDAADAALTVFVDWLTSDAAVDAVEFALEFALLGEYVSSDYRYRARAMATALRQRALDPEVDGERD